MPKLPPSQDASETSHSRSDRLQALEQRIKAAQAPKDDNPHIKKDYSQAQLAWRMVVELVAGLMVGFGIGYGLDYLFGTMPLFMIIFIGFGFVAGIKTMLRTAKEVASSPAARTASEEKESKSDGTDSSR